MNRITEKSKIEVMNPYYSGLLYEFQFKPREIS